MSMMDLMWLAVGAFIGSLVAIFIIGMLNASRDDKELEQTKRQIDALKRLLQQADDMNTKVCPICGHEYRSTLEECPVCGCPAYVELTKAEDLVDKIMEASNERRK